MLEKPFNIHDLLQYSKCEVFTCSGRRAYLSEIWLDDTYPLKGWIYEAGGIKKNKSWNLKGAHIDGRVHQDDLSTMYIMGDPIEMETDF